jgi:hypothetical protein
MMKTGGSKSGVECQTAGEDWSFQINKAEVGFYGKFTHECVIPSEGCFPVIVDERCREGALEFTSRAPMPRYTLDNLQITLCMMS